MLKSWLPPRPEALSPAKLAALEATIASRIEAPRAFVTDAARNAIAQDQAPTISAGFFSKARHETDAVELTANRSTQWAAACNDTVPGWDETAWVAGNDRNAPLARRDLGPCRDRARQARPGQSATAVQLPASALPSSDLILGINYLTMDRGGHCSAFRTITRPARESTIRSGSAPRSQCSRSPARLASGQLPTGGNMLGNRIREYPPAFRRIRTGEPVPWSIFDADGLLLLKKGLPVEDERQLRELTSRGVVTQEMLGFDLPNSRSRVRSPRATRKSGSPFWIWENLQKRLKRLSKTIAEPESGFVEDVRELAALVDSSANQNIDAACFFVTQSSGADYPISHMIHTAIICSVVARRLAWDDEKRMHAICAALTMNLGMVDLQERLWSAQGALTDRARSLIRTHPANGVRILQGAGLSDPSWLDAVRQHHENSEGTGYPGGVPPSEVADLVGKADVLSARISPRKYRRGFSPSRALRDLYLRNEERQDQVIMAMIHVFGIYPPGSFVRLANNEIGVVVSRGASSITPVVAAVIDRQGIPHGVPVRRDTGLPHHKIRSDLPPDSVRLWLNWETLFEKE